MKRNQTLLAIIAACGITANGCQEKTTAPSFPGHVAIGNGAKVEVVYQFLSPSPQGVVPLPQHAGGPSSTLSTASSSSATVQSDEILGSGVTIWYTDRKAFENVEQAVKLVYDLYETPDFRNFMENATDEQRARVPRVIREFYQRGIEAHANDNYTDHSVNRQEQVRTLLERYLSSLTINGAKKITSGPSTSYWGKLRGKTTTTVDFAGLDEEIPMSVELAQGILEYANKDCQAVNRYFRNVNAHQESPSREDEPSQEPLSRYRMPEGENKSWAQESPAKHEARVQRRYGDFFGRAKTPQYTTGRGSNFWSPQSVQGGYRR